ncbi:MAG: hypothetical protein ACRD2W_06750 [Acidimicrobiales bacterium]
MPRAPRWQRPPEPPGNRGRPVVPNPGSGLAEFVEQHRTVLQRGYVEMRLPDGTIAYGAQVDGSFVTVVQVAPLGTGWVVTGFELSGC